MSDSTYNHQEFDESFRRFLNICEKILKKRDDLTQDLDLEGKGNPILKCLRQYMRCYSKTTPQEREGFHVDLFREIFDEHKYSILDSGHVNTDWLLHEKIILIYGSNMGLGNKSRIRIYLSHIFEMAVIMKADSEKKLHGKTEQDYTEADELNYPDAYLLYLYRIFKSLRHEPTDTAKLTIIISDLEERLGLSEGNQNMNPGTGLDGLLQFATGMMGQMGLPSPPEGAQAPSGDDVGTALQNVFGNPKTQEAISGMFKDLDKCDDIGDVIGKLVNGMSNPQFKDAIGESLNGMADARVEGGGKEDGEKRDDKKEDGNKGDGKEVTNDDQRVSEPVTEVPPALIPSDRDSSNEVPSLSPGQSIRPEVRSHGEVPGSRITSEVPDGEIPIVGDD